MGPHQICTVLQQPVAETYQIHTVLQQPVAETYQIHTVLQTAVEPLSKAPMAMAKAQVELTKSDGVVVRIKTETVIGSFFWGGLAHGSKWGRGNRHGMNTTFGKPVAHIPDGVVQHIDYQQVAKHYIQYTAYRFIIT